MASETYADQLRQMEARWQATAPVQAADGTWHDPSSTAPTSFYDVYRQWKGFDFDGFLASRTAADVAREIPHEPEAAKRRLRASPGLPERKKQECGPPSFRTEVTPRST